MRWGIFADVHGNLEAWQAVRKAYKKEGIDQYICLGDLVGYGANPAECIAEIRKISSVIIAGNHDWAAVDLFDADYFNPQAKQAVVWTGQNLSAEDKQFLKGLRLVYQQEELTLVHGSLSNCAQFEYIMDVASAAETFAILKSQICFIGHSHVPVVFIKQGQDLSHSLDPKIKLESAKTYIVNVGSVGQPRDANPQAAYAVYDSENKTLEIKRTPYNIKKAQEKIVRAGLPQILAERLAIGR
ncbi:metallophosphoesterase family protein [Candidatus Omnitrophota bacterium]